MNLVETVKNLVVVTVDELTNILKDVTNSTVVSVVYTVDHAKSKSVKGAKQIQKTVQINNVYLNHDYTQKVKNLTGNAEFVAQPLKGKTRVSTTLLMSDKTNALMLDGKVLNSESAKIVSLQHNGVVITEAQAIALDLWANSYYKETTKKTSGRGTVSTEDDFRIINTYLSRINRIKIQGTTYIVK